MTHRFKERAAPRAALFVFAAALSASAAAPAAFAEARIRTGALSIDKAAGGSISVRIEIAESEQEKAKGLMFRTKMADGEGMLFLYGKPFEITMWMRNTYITLDMVFIRPDGVIHRIEQKAEPLSDRVIASQGAVSAVLEMPGGAAERLGIKAGDRVRHEAFADKPAR